MHSKRLLSLFQNYMRQGCTESARKQRMALCKGVQLVVTCSPWGLLFRPADDDAQLRVVSDAAWWQQHRLQHHQHHRGHHPAPWFHRSLGEFVTVECRLVVSSHLVFVSPLIQKKTSLDISHLVSSHRSLGEFVTVACHLVVSSHLISSLVSSCHVLSVSFVSSLKRHL